MPGLSPAGWRVRRTDYEFLTSSQARALLQSERIAVIGHRTIQQAWARNPDAS
jgi:hypothetical protein